MRNFKFSFQNSEERNRENYVAREHIPRSVFKLWETMILVVTKIKTFLASSTNVSEEDGSGFDEEADAYTREFVRKNLEIAHAWQEVRTKAKELGIQEIKDEK